MKFDHFVTDQAKLETLFLTDEDYGKALQAIVVACADIVIITGQGDELKILLGKRTYEPHPDWWIVGGRMRPGESPQEAAIRNLKRELGLDKINPDRLSLLAIHSLVWPTRRQEPQNLGCHTLSLTFLLVLRSEEVEAIRPNEEYSQITWVKPADIMVNRSYHPATRAVAQDVLNLMVENSWLLNR